MLLKIIGKAKKKLESIARKIETRVHGGVIKRFYTDQKVVALTFDDGPHHYWTPKLIDLLNEYGAKATFFVVGTNVEKHPEIVKKMADTGHAVANHTWDHPYLPSLTKKERKISLQKGSEMIDEYNTEKLFRPPWGALTKYSTREIIAYGYNIIAWNIVANDWESEATLQTMYDRIARKIKPGSIILLHDMLYDIRESDRSDILVLVERIIKDFGDEYRFLSIPEMGKIAKPVVTHWDFKS